eukprot:GGOE01014302.1.p1 GENE.GGOE01014302.1~~GGOE01014302.1.p1  ORF type:complete len:270 (+),score=86.01 GGOE01014302.1:51-860(+)
MPYMPPNYNHHSGAPSGSTEGDDEPPAEPRRKRKGKSGPQRQRKGKAVDYNVMDDYSFVPKRVREIMKFNEETKARAVAKRELHKHRKMLKAERQTLVAAKSGNLPPEPVGPEAGEKVVRRTKIELLKPWLPLVQKIQGGAAVSTDGLEKPKMIIKKEKKRKRGGKAGSDSEEETGEIVGFTEDVAQAPPNLTFAPKYSDQALFPDKLVWKEAVKMRTQSSKPMDKSREAFEQLRLDVVERYRQYKGRIAEMHQRSPATGQPAGKRRRL